MASPNPNRVCAIYTITSPSGRVYVGQSRHVYQRFQFYRYNKKDRGQPGLMGSFLKYGVSAHRFEVQHWLPSTISQVNLDAFEQLYMDSYRSRGYALLNAKEAGYRGALSIESRRKISLKLKGHPVSQESIERLRIASSGRRRTEEAKERLRQFWLGRKRGPMSEAHKSKLSSAHQGHVPWNKNKSGVYSPETIAAIKAARAKQPKINYTDEMRARMSEAAKKRGISDATRTKINETKRRNREDAGIHETLRS